MELLVASSAVATLLGAWRAKFARGIDDRVESLHHAATAGRLGELSELVDGGLNVDAVAEGARTPLAAAAANGHYEAVMLLMSLGADVGKGDAAQAAAAHGHSLILQRLLERDSSIAGLVDVHGQTPLHAACASGLQSAASAVSILLAFGAPMDVRRADQSTALALAASVGAAACVQALVECGCDVNSRDVNGSSPLHHACDGGHTAIARMLCEAGAALFCEDVHGQTPGDLAPAQTAAKGMEEGDSLRVLLDEQLILRLKRGDREANAAQVARSQLCDRLRMLASTDPVLLNDLCESSETVRLMLRFGIDLAAIVPRASLDERGLAVASQLQQRGRSSRACWRRLEEGLKEGGPSGMMEEDDTTLPLTARVSKSLLRMGDTLESLHTD